MPTQSAGSPRDKLLEILRLNPGVRALDIKDQFPYSLSTLRGKLTRYRRVLNIKTARPPGGVAMEVEESEKSPPIKEHVTVETQQDTTVASSCSPQIKSLEDLLKATKVDLNIWEVERHVINKWEVAMREPATTVGGAGDSAEVVRNKDGSAHTLWTRGSNIPMHEDLYQVKVWLRRKSPQILAGQALLKRLEANAPHLPLPDLRRKKLPHRRAFEICIMDPHIGLLCEEPEADAPWDIKRSAATIMSAIDDLMDKASTFGPFEQAFLPFGNDFVHSDTVFHTTTAGTGQPEAIAWHHVYEQAENIAIEMVEKLRQVAKELYIYEIPGNHSRMADFTLAHLLRAYFRHDKNIHIDASSSPYKFHRYGASLIGYEHGHSVSQIRLAGLMANERRKDWSETEYREFHLGDQHRKGSSNPATLEEQGVSVEFIPGLTAPNEWHRLKAFNHQKRGAMAWVYDFTAGPMARFQHNISQYSHAVLA